MREIVVYDNSIRPNEIIKDVIGDQGFGDVVVRKKTLKEQYREAIMSIYKDTVWESIDNVYDAERLLDKLGKLEENNEVKILHCISNFTIFDAEAVGLVYQKLPYANNNYFVKKDNQIVAVMFSNRKDYLHFLSKYIEQRDTLKVLSESTWEVLQINGVVYVGDINNFIQCVTGAFDARYFNSLKGDEFIIRKSSTNKNKILREYTYYQLLPDFMKAWFVMPFDYKDEGETSSYAMERLYMTDVAIRWVHKSIGLEEFKELMEIYFRFFELRSKKYVTEEEYKRISTDLYETKVRERIEQLKECDGYKKIAATLANDDKLISIDAIYERYEALRKNVEKKIAFPCISVIGHGDPCFANTMYYRATRTLKFIDPKGAMTEEELWTNPYYDIAKLSHSVCGRYDFFNNAMYEIEIGDDFACKLQIPFENDAYISEFRRIVEAHGYNYDVVRIYEISLFLSMLPLHMDRPHKVLGFIINAAKMIEEMENEL